MTFLIWLAESRPKNQDDPRTELENVSNSLLQKVILLKSVFLRFESGHEFKWFPAKKTPLIIRPDTRPRSANYRTVFWREIT